MQQEKRTKAVLFDLDGTLLNTLASMAKAGNQVLAELGLPPQPNQAYGAFSGDGADVLVERMLLAAGANLAECFSWARQQYRRYFAETCTYQVLLYPGILDLLRQLQAKGILLAVLSNKPHNQVCQVIQTYLPAGFFQAVQGQTEEIPKKPNPAGVQQILRQLQVDAAQCLYLGDTGVDIQTAKAAKIKPLGALWGFRTEMELISAGAFACLKQPLELLQYLK